VSDLATLEIALRQDCAYARLADSHAHRATREDCLTLTKGRDAITALWVAEGKQAVSIDEDLGDMIAYTVDRQWQGHRWVWREDGRTLREVAIEDRGEPKSAPPIHPPLGELRPAKGQFSAGNEAVLPPDFPVEARALANHLHQSWNGRAFNLYDGDWLRELIRLLPDATFQFERALIENGKTAFLWRVMGHHANGQRIRLIGSSIFAGDSDVTIFDRQALQAQLNQPKIEYA
jgi:hypothetical protein